MNVRPNLAGWYLFLASAQCLSALVLVVWQKSQTIAEYGIPTSILEIGQSLSPLVIIALADSLLIVEGTAMLAERYLKERYNKGREETHKLWAEWNQRREQAEKEGRDFNEPPPSSPKSD